MAALFRPSPLYTLWPQPKITKAIVNNFKRGITLPKTSAKPFLHGIGEQVSKDPSTRVSTINGLEKVSWDATDPMKTSTAGTDKRPFRPLFPQGRETIREPNPTFFATESNANRMRDMYRCTNIRTKRYARPTSTRILMKIRLEDVVASSLRRMDSRHVHGRASVYRRCAKNFATLRSLLVSSLRAGWRGG